MSELKLTCLTPLWTGDIDSRSNVLQLTGFIGSLRWWTETILRAMDIFACDPTEDSRCPQKRGNSRTDEFCCSCLIFGATGLRRLFRADIEGGNRIFTGGALNIKPDGRTHGWYLGNGIVGNISFKIIPLDNAFDENLILIPLLIASKWAGIGAKTQHGYGVIKIEDLTEINFGKFQEAIKKIKDQTRLSILKIGLRNDTSSGFPNLKEMFFAKVQFEVSNNEWWKEVDGIKKDTTRKYEGYINDQRMISWVNSASVPVAPAIKNWIRYLNGKNLWQGGNSIQNRQIENWLFGTTERVCSICYEKVGKDRNDHQKFWCYSCRKSLTPEKTFERLSSKINISCAYKVNNNKWEIRIWGWLPKDNYPEGFNRERFLNQLKQALTGNRGSLSVPWSQLLGSQTLNHNLTVWREYNSSRDTIKPNESDITNFMQSLINEGGH